MNILLLNAHSPRNAGDLAILHETLSCLHTAFPGCNITVAINDPGDDSLPASAAYVPSLTRWLVTLGANGSWRWRKPQAPFLAVWLFIAAALYRATGTRLRPRGSGRNALMAAYYGADLVAVIGGGHLYAPHAFNIAFLWLWVGLACAVIMGKPLVLLPQSFGPLPGRIQRGLLRWLINHSTLVAARELVSLQLLAEIGVRRRVLLLPDLAFTAAEATPTALAAKLPALCAARGSSGPLVGVTLMDWGGQHTRFGNQARYEEAMAALIVHIIERYEAQVALFAQCSGPTVHQDDRIVAARIAARLPEHALIRADIALPPDLLKAAYGQLDALVATRMHSAIFAQSAGVPTLAIGYLHKSTGIMQQIGLPHHVLDITEADEARAIRHFDALWAERDTVRAHLAARIPAMQHTLAHLPELLRTELQT